MKRLPSTQPASQLENINGFPYEQRPEQPANIKPSPIPSRRDRIASWIKVFDAPMGEAALQDQERKHYERVEYVENRLLNGNVRGTSSHIHAVAETLAENRKYMLVSRIHDFTTGVIHFGFDEESYRRDSSPSADPASAV